MFITTLLLAHAFINPGAVWNDTSGQPIQAHGGGIIKVGKTYFWYGENKSQGYNNKVGVSCYSSRDLIHWKNEGVALPAANLPTEFQAEGVCERPKVLYNKLTNTYVMWMHLDAHGYAVSEAGVAIAKRPQGPYKLISHFRPIAKSTFRDMNLFEDSDGKAYVVYAGEDNATMEIIALNSTYTSTAEGLVQGVNWTQVFANDYREAPALFKYKNTYYLISSQCTGWAPNAANYATASNILGPWTVHPNPCVGSAEEMKTTFGSQSTCVIPMPHGPANAFIFMADQWKPQNLADSRYVWLPFAIQPDGSFQLKWQPEWSPQTWKPKS